MKDRRFEKLCLIASRKNWCADIGCTTCGHMEFRRAWPLLARGYEPGTREWDRASDLLGGPPADLPESLSMLDRDALSRALADTRLEVIGGKCKSVTWLMYMGLGLYATERIEAETKRLTRAWVPQLLRMVEPEQARWLEELARDADRVLRWSDLAGIKDALQPQYRGAEGEDARVAVKRRLEALERERERLEERLRLLQEEH